MRLSCKPSPLGPPLRARCFLPQVEASVFLLLRRQADRSALPADELSTDPLLKHYNGEGKVCFCIVFYLDFDTDIDVYFCVAVSKCSLLILRLKPLRALWAFLCRLGMLPMFMLLSPPNR